MLQNLLDSWQLWSIQLVEKPRVVQPLAGGKTNCSYILQSGEIKLVLRHNASKSAQLGIDRDHEKVILQQLAGIGLAPRVYLCDPEQNLLVTEYIEGKPLDITHPDALIRLQGLMERVHAVKPQIPVFDYIAHAENYWQQLASVAGESATMESRVRLQKPLKKLQSASGQGLCHHDLVPENIIDRDGELILLDWEYAGFGAPEFDRAAIRAEWPGFCVAPTRSEIQQAADTVYREFCRLWHWIQQL